MATRNETRNLFFIWMFCVLGLFTVLSSSKHDVKDVIPAIRSRSPSQDVDFFDLSPLERKEIKIVNEFVEIEEIPKEEQEAVKQRSHNEPRNEGIVREQPVVEHEGHEKEEQVEQEEKKPQEDMGNPDEELRRRRRTLSSEEDGETSIHPVKDHECPPLEKIVVKASGGNVRQVDCDVPCEWHGGISLISTVTVVDTDIKILFSMEGPVYYPKLLKKEGNNALGTTSFKSEVPVAYFSWAEYDIQTPAIDYDNVIKGASFMARNCASQNQREQLVKDMQKYIRVDSLSSCLHNANPPPGVSMRNKVEVLRQYLFHFSFENQCYEDYITEKLWGALQSGSLPVYYGAPNVLEHAPPHSIVDVNSFASREELGKYLDYLTKNKTAYDEYHAWRKKPLPWSFRKKYEYAHWNSRCRLCRFAFAKKHNLPWNIPSQTSTCPYEKNKISVIAVRKGKTEDAELENWVQYALYIGASNVTIYDITSVREERIRINNPLVHVIHVVPETQDFSIERMIAFEHYAAHRDESAVWVMCLPPKTYPLNADGNAPRGFLKDIAAEATAAGVDKVIIGKSPETVTLVKSTSIPSQLVKGHTHDCPFANSGTKSSDKPLKIETKWSGTVESKAKAGIQETELRFIKLHQDWT